MIAFVTLKAFIYSFIRQIIMAAKYQPLFLASFLIVPPLIPLSKHTELLTGPRTLCALSRPLLTVLPPPRMPFPSPIEYTHTHVCTHALTCAHTHHSLCLASGTNVSFSFTQLKGHFFQEVLANPPTAYY